VAGVVDVHRAGDLAGGRQPSDAQVVTGAAVASLHDVELAVAVVEGDALHGVMRLVQQDVPETVGRRLRQVEPRRGGHRGGGGAGAQRSQRARGQHRGSARFEQETTGQFELGHCGPPGLDCGSLASTIASSKSACRGHVIMTLGWLNPKVV
jgi:hypothetical protein